jgi:hypothetical protein
MSGSGLVFKTRDNARVADDDDSPGSSVARKTRVETRVADDDHDAYDADSAAAASAFATSETATTDPWWKWVERHCEYRIKVLCDAVGEVLGEFRAQAREHCNREIEVLKRELELTRRELTVLRQEVGVERGLDELRSKVTKMHDELPKLPTIVVHLEKEQDRLEKELWSLRYELDATKKRLGRVRVDQSLTNYGLSELRTEVQASHAESVELEFESEDESRINRFQMRALHPQAAEMLKKFAAQVIASQRSGMIWTPDLVGKA